MENNALVATFGTYDIVMLAVLILATILGAWKGMAWQIASLASIVLSAFVSINFSEPLAPLFGEKAPLNRWIAALVLFLGTSLVIWIISKIVAKIIDRVKLKEFDRQMGAFFGLAKGILLCIVITFFVVPLSENLRQAVLTSYSGRGISIAIKNATPVLPTEITDVFGKYIAELDRRLDPNAPPEEGLIDRLAPGADKKGGEIIGGISDGIKKEIDKKVGDLKNSANNQLKGAQQQIDKKAEGVKNTVGNESTDLKGKTQYLRDNLKGLFQGSGGEGAKKQ